MLCSAISEIQKNLNISKGPLKIVHIFEPEKEVIFGNINIKSTFKAYICTFWNIGFPVRLDWKMGNFAMLGP